MKNSFWNKIQTHNASLLASQINAKGGSAKADIDSIIDNMKYLVDKGESFGEETTFLRLDIKRLLGTLCDSGRLVFKVEPATIHWAPDNSAVSVTGYLYEVREDGTEVRVSGFSCGGAARQDVYAQDELTSEQRTASMLGLASARAESNAYFNAGIGMEYKGDIFDLEALEAQIPAPAPVMPSPVSQEERKVKRAAKKAAKPEAVPVPETPKPAEATPETKPEPAKASEEPKQEATEAPAEINGITSTMTYDEALKHIIDIGVNSGKPSSYPLEKPQTARNIVWLIKNAPADRPKELSDALMVAVEGYDGGGLKKYL